MNQPNQSQQKNQSLALPTSKEYKTFYVQQRRKKRILRSVTEAVLGEAPVIVTQPVDQTVTALTEPASFSVAATVDSGTLAYEWEVDAGTGFTTIPLESLPTIQLASVPETANGNRYRAKVKANGRVKLSRPANLKVNVAL